VNRPISRAFTLIELLMVVAIISVLLSILLPSLGAAREQSRQAICASNLRQIGVGIYSYWTDWNGRVPYVESPMVNGVGSPPRTKNNFPGFGNPNWSDDDTDPFNRDLFPMSLPNQLMPRYLDESPRVFACPSAINGWPRNAGPPYRYTYREAAANQPHGRRNELNRYLIETFAFLDGRMLNKLRVEVTGNPLADAQEIAKLRSTYVRDLVTVEGEGMIGPHRGGIMTLDRDLQVKYRSAELMREDLAPFVGTGSRF
jgi:prepilin-type N-terminal cleavage/methylation domain-containing protein